MPEAKPVLYKVKVRDVSGYICVKDSPCKIVEIRTALAPAKHQFVAIDIFSGKVFKATFPLSGTCFVPHVTYTDYLLLDISDDDSYVTLLDDKGNIKDDLKLPTDKALLSQINFGFTEGKDVFVTVVSAMGKEQIIASKGLLGKSLSHNFKREGLFDCEQKEELKVVLKRKDEVFSSCDEQIVQVRLERKIKILDDYVKQLMESNNLDAIQEIKEMLIRDPKLADGLEPLVFQRLVKILVDNNSESTKGSAACILGFANIDKCDAGFKEDATKVLVQLMSDDSETISIPVLRTLTRLAHLHVDYASYIIEKGALEGALAVKVDPFYPNLKVIQNLAKFLVVVVCQVKVPSKVNLVVPILNKILQVRESNLRYMVRACYALSLLQVEDWINEGKICQYLIEFIRDDWNDMVAFSALKVVANIVESGNSSQIEILTKKHKFLQCLGSSGICCKPKKFQKEVCHIISKLAAAKGRTFIKDMYKAGLIDALSKLLEDVDVRAEAAWTIRNVVIALKKEEHDRRCYITKFSHCKVSWIT